MNLVPCGRCIRQIKIQSIIQCNFESVLLEDHVRNDSLDDVRLARSRQRTHQQMDVISLRVFALTMDCKDSIPTFHFPAFIFHLFYNFSKKDISQSEKLRHKHGLWIRPYIRRGASTDDLTVMQN